MRLQLTNPNTIDQLTECEVVNNIVDGGYNNLSLTSQGLPVCFDDSNNFFCLHWLNTNPFLISGTLLNPNDDGHSFGNVHSFAYVDFTQGSKEAKKFNPNVVHNLSTKVFVNLGNLETNSKKFNLNFESMFEQVEIPVGLMIDLMTNQKFA